MDDRRALMAAIIANPDEDTPRLVLADWLQEHGDKHDRARAEFIRLQIQAENATDAKARAKLASRAAKLAMAHRKAWLAPLTAISAGLDPGDFVGFSRGLLSFLFVHTSAFLMKPWQSALPDALASVGVEELCFYSPTKKLADFANSPAIRWVAELQYPGADDKALAAFARSPQFAHLGTLTLVEARFTDAGLRDFAKHTGMSRLRAVSLSTEGALANTKAKFTAAGVLALLNNDRLPRLASLDITCRSAERFGLKKFLADPALAKLTSLSLVIPLRAADVIDTPHLKNLRVLQLHEAEMTDADAEALLSSRTLAKLEELYLMLDSPLSPSAEMKLKKRFGDKFSHNA